METLRAKPYSTRNLRIPPSRAFSVRSDSFAVLERELTELARPLGSVLASRVSGVWRVRAGMRT